MIGLGKIKHKKFKTANSKFKIFENINFFLHKLLFLNYYKYCYEKLFLLVVIFSKKNDIEKYGD
ncbi:hypothetical protein BpHYR1_016522 [Brachionus plicatilis]|uniref:Uncharacterized protein n=1 Tax=Brachionus plicatilis TaxID=10195 RepID=A0A3M7R7C2_BRAPC|nr:hypothetical protein BpHYR1_016522 [Brachionus plicatilis]